MLLYSFQGHITNLMIGRENTWTCGEISDNAGTYEVQLKKIKKLISRCLKKNNLRAYVVT